MKIGVPKNGEPLITRLMEQARLILAPGVTNDRLAEVGRLLSRFAHGGEELDAAQMRSMHGTESTATVLQSDPDGLTLVLGVFSARAETPVHDHGAWGVACVIRGQDRYRHWERVDDGSDAEQGRLRLLYERTLGPGEYAAWMDPPHDIHSQQGLGEAALELVLFGKNVMVSPRRYFDLETGTIRTQLPL